MDLVGRARAVEAAQQPALLVPVDQRLGLLVVDGEPLLDGLRLVVVALDRAASRPGRRRPRSSAGRTPRGRRGRSWRRCAGPTAAARPRRRARRSAARRSARGPRLSSACSSISAWPIVRGKPSSRKPSSASPESSRSSITSQISSSGTRSPGPCTPWPSCRARSSLATASRRMFRSRSRAGRSRRRSRSACVPFPAPGGPSRTRLQLGSLEEALVVAHHQLRLELLHRVERHADHDQDRGAAEVEVRARLVDQDRR